MINIPKKILFILIGIFIVSCTNRNSPIGFPGTSFESHEIVLEYPHFVNIYTFQDTMHNFPGNTKLILGNYNGADARVLMRFISWPRNARTIELDEDPEITLFINRRHNPSTFDINVALIDTVKKNIFMENEATWTHFNNNTEWDIKGGDFHEPPLRSREVNVETDTLRFTIDKSIVHRWMRVTDFRDNFGIIIYSENAKDSFIEFHSTESAPHLRPQIELKYALPNGNKETQVMRANFDTFIHNMQPELKDPFDLRISNIPPRSIYALFNLNYEKFKGVESKEELRLINVNQAFLIFTVDQKNTLMTNTRYSLEVAIPFSKPIEVQRTFDFNNMWTYAPVADSLRAGRMYLNVTGPIQRIVSGGRENNGIVFRNRQRNQDFSHISLFGLEDELESRPKLLIRYSVKK